MRKVEISDFRFHIGRFQKACGYEIIDSLLILCIGSLGCAFQVTYLVSFSTEIDYGAALVQYGSVERYTFSEDDVPATIVFVVLFKFHFVTPLGIAFAIVSQKRYLTSTRMSDDNGVTSNGFD